jgi:glyoxylase-like metal-dependent hydrolase (beta-lactamase superfamily II)
MYFEQFYLGCLAHASYLLASEGDAVVVDPQRDVELYLKAAEEHGLKIRHIFETHLHADFVSGHKELAARTGAKIYMGAQAGATLPHVAVCDGYELKFGKASIRVLETPGHTSESICLVVKTVRNRRSRGRCSRATRFSLAMSDVLICLRSTLLSSSPACSTTACTTS